jgi:hypothetical protein
MKLNSLSGKSHSRPDRLALTAVPRLMIPSTYSSLVGTMRKGAGAAEAFGERDDIGPRQWLEHSSPSDAYLEHQMKNRRYHFPFFSIFLPSSQSPRF